ncbi:CbiX/SirB N-terminal domain-containing protein [Streptomyces litchfieldiae]|uniref:CbiX/SirB N-terminal domain-containing protein n=1 Tax=Streptomyces litchfieldiae TaxID=3075543 RepID=A0ABU2MTI8_9ACTN|nr:CbiX/SirB N-terminal domain-containing protein [Streptomyces sp. DSM 44938]MDT0344850.1 CbiX/SirB N-terminal domain-containing protein [Streptomyces sp. DSM 44938]
MTSRRAGDRARQDRGARARRGRPPARRSAARPPGRRGGRAVRRRPRGRLAVVGLDQYLARITDLLRPGPRVLASGLGAPFGHDHATISRSDLHAPWEVVERRVRAAAEAGLAVAFCSHGQPLGPHPDLLAVLERRVDEVAPPDARPGTTGLLVGRGSTAPDANAEVFKAARLLWEGRAFAGVETAFVSLAAPDVATGLDRCRALGACRIVVLPDRVRALVLARYRETVHGDIRMNCDACVYRVALPGFADRVGQPQRPHHHPGDHGHAHVH